MIEIQDIPFAEIEGTDTASLRMPPHSIEAEQSVLGGIMLDTSAWDRVADRLGEDDFYRRDHRLIYRALGHLAETGNGCDVVTVSDWLKDRGELANVGGLVFLTELAKNTPSAANIAAYADIVRSRSILRGLIRVSAEIADSAYRTEGRDANDLLNNAEQLVFAIAEQGKNAMGGFKDMTTTLTSVVKRVHELHESPDAITGIATGFHDLDEQTSGLQKSDLVIIAGRPSMGKTAFAMNLVGQAAIKAKMPVAVFSMEMPAEQLVLRMLSTLGRIDQQHLRTGRLADHDWPRFTSAMSILQEARIFIDDTPALNPVELRARCRRLKREHGLGLVVVDYLQLMQAAGTSRENRATEISEISRGLKALAKELNVPVVALSQLNRSLEQRPNKRPVMSDLRESGAIEQDADVIVFIYRDEVYNEDSADKGIAEIIIGKQRNGPIGTIKLTFLGHITSFENYVPEQAAGGFYS